MSGVARVIGQIASIVAIAASIALLFVPGGQVFGVALLTIATAAGAVAAIANTVAMATQKPPDMRGTVSQVMIGNNLPLAYALGISYLGGALIYDDSNGGSNQWRYQVIVTSAAGPIEGKLKFLADYKEVTNSAEFGGDGVNGWYEGWLYTQFRNGDRPDTAFAATGPHTMPDWTSDHKLSGYSAYRVQMKFDKDGERYASGIPQFGMIAKWTKQYDPRLDDTYPGGAGACRFDDESTFVFGAAGTGTVAPGQNPALQALTYARGRFIEKDAGGTPLPEPVKICGIGYGKDQIRMADFVELANLCDANGWVAGGAVYEAPGLNKWDNLKRILQAAGAEPVDVGGVLSLKWSAPKTPVFTIGRDQLADGELVIPAMKPWRDRINTAVARVRLSSSKWEYEQLEPVTSSTYTDEDGETKTKEIQFDLVGSDDAEATADQAAQLAAYAVANSRELGPWTIPCKPEMLPFRPGEAGVVRLGELLDDSSLPDRGVVITGRQVNPATGVVTLIVETETDAKHAWALGQVGVAPPSPTIVDSQDLDEAVADPGYDEPPADAVTIELVSWTDQLVMRTDPIARAQSYVWNFYDPGDTATPIATIETAVPQVAYTRAAAHADGVRRDYVVGVLGRNSPGGDGAEVQSGTLTKAAPAAPTSVAFADGTSTSAVTFTPPGGQAGVLVAWSTNSSFDPMTEGSSMFASTSPAYTPQLPAASYFGKVAAYDVWSWQPDLLNFSAEDGFTITPGGGGSPPAGGGGGGFGGGGGGGFNPN